MPADITSLFAGGYGHNLEWGVSRSLEPSLVAIEVLEVFRNQENQDFTGGRVFRGVRHMREMGVGRPIRIVVPSLYKPTTNG